MAGSTWNPLWVGIADESRTLQVDDMIPEHSPTASERKFWTDIVALRGSATPRVVRRLLVFGAIAAFVCALNDWIDPYLGSDLSPVEVAGAVLGVLLVFRTNAGYDRWYEGRKLWGGIVNESRNLATAALALGSRDPAWRDEIVRWTAAFCHVARASLRGEKRLPEVERLLGAEAARKIAAARHMPGFVALRIAELANEARQRGEMDGFALLAIESQRAMLIECLGGCERIVRTPIPAAYAINIRRFVFMYLTALPFALLHRIGWFCPLVTMLVAYPILELDELGAELQDPFSLHSLNHLPLDQICETIEGNLLALIAVDASKQQS